MQKARIVWRSVLYLYGGIVSYCMNKLMLVLLSSVVVFVQGSDGGGSVVFSSGEFGSRGVAGAAVGPGGAPPAGGGPVGGGASPAPAPLPQPAPSPAPAALPPPPYTTSNMQVRSSHHSQQALILSVTCVK